MKRIACVDTRGAGLAILAHPLRPRILALARVPVSAAELARQLEQPRQRVNYHVRQLASAGLLVATDKVARRNMVEQQYLASAEAYVLAPEILGDAGPQARVAGDGGSAAELLMSCSKAAVEVARVMEAADAAGVRVRTMKVEQELFFESAEQRAAFLNELSAAISEVISRHHAARGRPFRLLLGCYPAVI